MRAFQTLPSADDPSIVSKQENAERAEKADLCFRGQALDGFADHLDRMTGVNRVLGNDLAD
jgi:hypothetical protein